MTLKLSRVRPCQIFIISLMVFCSYQGFCQIDLKNSLNDLKAQINTAKDDNTKAKLAITIGSFFLTIDFPIDG
ncbi:hypothetical protein FPZ43_07200 [Mucilaginibacter pallidiroseus]|uniref:Uncharacterized protein n=1 Tax=Mucilaginibacter pallidiroseus TaxID=2599295 RepID=A0A563UEC3_9SPHI|nr:hypothetical protein [Mucilaginibacter pallidiroseus]TWR29643.1 hypothetical protein FPZ43_07200 [Mucilaginibacter pallidiroseus]